MTTLRPNAVITSLPCDEPYFIRTDQNYLKAWTNFVKQGENIPYKFYISSEPSNISELLFSKERAEMWLNGTIKNSSDIFSLTGNFIFTRDSTTESQFNQNNFLSPFNYVSQSSNDPFLIVGGYPILRLIEKVSNELELSQVQEIFEDFIESLDPSAPGQKEMDFEVRHSEVCIRPQTDYLAQIVRQTAEIANNTLVIIPKNYQDELHHSWRRMPEEIIPLNTYLEYTNNAEYEGFTDYVEKIAILDILYDRFISNYFINNNRFPLKPKGKDSFIFLSSINDFMLIWHTKQHK